MTQTVFSMSVLRSMSSTHTQRFFKPQNFGGNEMVATATKQSILIDHRQVLGDRGLSVGGSRNLTGSLHILQCHACNGRLSVEDD